MRFFALFLVFVSFAESSYPIDRSIITTSSIDTALINSLLQKVEHYLPSQTDSAYLYVRQIEELADTQDNPPLLARSYHLLGRIFFNEAAFDRSLSCFLQADKLWEEEGDEYWQARNRNGLGQVYYFLQQPEAALRQYQQALLHFMALNDTAGIAETHGHLGHYYEKQGIYDSALYYQEQALELLKRLPAWQATTAILDNIGSIYEDLQAYDTAQWYFARALEITLQHEGQSQAISLYNNLGDVYFKTGSYDSARIYTMKALGLARQYGDKYQLRSALRDLSQLQAAEGDYSAAYASLDSSVALYKEIFSEEGMKQMARLQTIYETERKNREIQLLEKDQRINRLMLGLSGIGLAVTLLLGVTVAKKQRRKLRANREVMTRNQELFDAQQKLMEVELHNTQLSKKQLTLEVEKQRQGLTAHTLHLIKKNQLLQELKECIQTVPTRDPKEARKHLKGLGKKIDQSFTEDTDWEDFRKMFEQVHHSFFDNLKKINPNLTQAELRLSALIKMHLNTKDMAAMLGVGYDSLRIARYRLRKKLELVRKQKLDEFIQSVH